MLTWRNTMQMRCRPTRSSECWYFNMKSEGCLSACSCYLCYHVQWQQQNLCLSGLGLLNCTVLCVYIELELSGCWWTLLWILLGCHLCSFFCGVKACSSCSTYRSYWRCTRCSYLLTPLTYIIFNGIVAWLFGHCSSLYKGYKAQPSSMRWLVLFLLFIILLLLILGLAIFFYPLVIHMTAAGGVTFILKLISSLQNLHRHMIILSSSQLIVSLKKHRGANSDLKFAIDIW